MLSEKQLIADCQRGVKSSQYELVRRYTGMLKTVCRRYAPDESKVKDLVQETFIRIFSNIENYQPTGSFEGWMRRIAVRCSLQWLAKNYNKREAQPEVMPEGQPLLPKALENLAVAEIHALIAELPYGYRTIFNLFVVEGYSHKEIGHILNITESTSRSQLTRAKIILQKKLKKYNTSKYKSA